MISHTYWQIGIVMHLFYTGYPEGKWNILFIIEKILGEIIIFKLFIFLATSANDLGFHWCIWKEELLFLKSWFGWAFYLWVTSGIICFMLLWTVVDYWFWTRPWWKLVTTFNLRLGLLLTQYMGSVVLILHFCTLRADVDCCCCCAQWLQDLKMYLRSCCSCLLFMVVLNL